MRNEPDPAPAELPAALAGVSPEELERLDLPLAFYSWPAEVQERHVRFRRQVLLEDGDDRVPPVLRNEPNFAPADPTWLATYIDPNDPDLPPLSHEFYRWPVEWQERYLSSRKLARLPNPASYAPMGLGPIRPSPKIPAP